MPFAGKWIAPSRAENDNAEDATVLWCHVSYSEALSDRRSTRLPCPVLPGPVLPSVRSRWTSPASVVGARLRHHPFGDEKKEKKTPPNFNLIPFFVPRQDRLSK